MEVEIYESLDGNCPINNYLSNQNKKTERVITGKFKLLEKFTYEELKHSKIITRFEGYRKLGEVTINRHRITLTIINKICWLLHGFLKQGNKTPPKEIRIALKLKDDLEERFKNK